MASGETVAQLLVEIGADIQGLLDGMATAKTAVDEFQATSASSADAQDVFGTRVSARLSALARDYQTLGQSEQEAAASAESARSAIEQSVASAAQRRVNTVTPAEAVAPLDSAVSARLEQVAAQYRLLGQSSEQAAASAGLLRPAIEQAVTDQAQAKLERLVPTLKEVGSAGNPLSGIFASVSKEMGNIGTMAAGMATGMIAADVVMSVAGNLTKAAEAIDTFGTAVRKVQVVTGATAEDSSRLVVLFERYGLTADDAANKLSRFERALTGTDTALDLTETGGKRGAQILQDFGVQTRDATGNVLPMIDVLLNLSDRWKDMDAESRNAAARTLFGGLGGQGGEAMNLLLSQGRQNLEAVIAAADKYGLTLSGDNLKDVIAFTMAHKDMDLALQGLSVQLGAAFMPSITTAAEALTALTRVVVGDLVPMIKAIPGWIVPATLAVAGLSIGFTALKFVFSPLGGLIEAAFSGIGKLAGAVFTEGAIATVSAGENVVLAGSETLAGTEAATAAPKVAGFGAAAAGAIGGVVSLAAAIVALAAASAMPIIGINAEQNAGDVNKKILGALSDDQRKEAQDYIDSHMQQISDAGGGQITQTGERLVLEEWLKAHGIDETALIGDTSSSGSIIDKIKSATDGVGQSVADAVAKIKLEIPNAIPNVTPGAGTGAQDSASVKAATAAAEAAKAHLQQLQDEQEKRKLDYDKAHVADETNLLQLKIAHSQAQQELLGYQRQIEDLDRNAIDYAQKRLQLDEKDAVTRATANLNELQYQASERKNAFDLAHVDAETNVLQLKLSQSQADAELLDYKRQMEDLDASAVDYAQKRVDLDQQDAITRAQMAANPLKAADEDLSYQERLLKAQLAASRHGGPAVDRSAIHRELKDLHNQSILLQPSLLMAEHDTTLAERAKGGSDLQNQLKGTALDRSKLDIEEAMRPAQAEATARQRAAEDAQRLLDLDKQRAAIGEQLYKPTQLMAEAVKAAAEHAKALTDTLVSLKDSALERAKISIQEAMQPFLDAATAAKRVMDDASSALDLAKLKFDVDEKGYEIALLQAQLDSKKAAQDLTTAKNAGAGSTTINANVTVYANPNGGIDHLRIVNDVYAGIAKAVGASKADTVQSPQLGGSRYAA